VGWRDGSRRVRGVGEMESRRENWNADDAD